MTSNKYQNVLRECANVLGKSLSYTCIILFILLRALRGLSSRNCGVIIILILKMRKKEVQS